MKLDFSKVKDWKLETKLLGISSLISVMILIVLVTVFWSNSSIESNLKEIVKRDVSIVIDNFEIGSNISRIFSVLTLLGNSHVKYENQWNDRKLLLQNLVQVFTFISLKII